MPSLVIVTKRNISNTKRTVYDDDNNKNTVLLLLRPTTIEAIMITAETPVLTIWIEGKSGSMGRYKLGVGK